MTFELPNLVKAAVPALVMAVPADAVAIESAPDGYPRHMEQMALGVTNVVRQTAAHTLSTASTAASEMTIRVARPMLALSVHDEKRFAALAAKEAVGEASASDMAELEQLDARRTATQRRLPVDAIHARERLFQKMDSLLSELSKLGSNR